MEDLEPAYEQIRGDCEQRSLDPEQTHLLKEVEPETSSVSRQSGSFGPPNEQSEVEPETSSVSGQSGSFGPPSDVPSYTRADEVGYLSMPTSTAAGSGNIDPETCESSMTAEPSTETSMRPVGIGKEKQRRNILLNNKSRKMSWI
jgi:hypothetical protein